MRHLLLVCLGLPALAAELAGVPKAIEKRYNSLRTLKADFEESVSYGGRNRRQERGALYLLRPGKMRWEYTEPAGKLFVYDGKMFWLYSPNANQVRRIPPKQTDDLRAPLAFLLGRLDFSKQFGRLIVEATVEGIQLTAAARTDRELFSKAVFTVAAQDYRIRRIAVHGQDGSLTQFQFSGEIVNVPLDSRLFRFQAPPGAEMVAGVE